MDWFHKSNIISSIEQFDKLCDCNDLYICQTINGLEILCDNTRYFFSHKKISSYNKNDMFLEKHIKNLLPLLNKVITLSYCSKLLIPNTISFPDNPPPNMISFYSDDIVHRIPYSFISNIKKFNIGSVSFEDFLYFSFPRSLETLNIGLIIDDNSFMINEFIKKISLLDEFNFEFINSSDKTTENYIRKEIKKLGIRSNK